MDFVTITVFVLLALAVSRGTRIITTDKIGEPLREWCVNRFGAGSMITYFVHCRACTSIWVSAVASPFGVWMTHVSWWYLVLLIPAVSYVTILLSEMESGD